MVTISYDNDIELLMIKVEGVFGMGESVDCLETLRSVLSTVPRGYWILSDFSRVQRIDREATPNISRIMALCNHHGVDTVVRVLPHPHSDIGLGILSIFHYCPSVRIIACKTMAEALDALVEARQVEPAMAA